MAFVPVDIYVTDTGVQATPISGVIAQALHPTTLVLQQEVTTDVDGKASFLLNGSGSPGTEYEVRFFKTKTAFENPARIKVVDDGSVPNAFDVKGSDPLLPRSESPQYCRVTGYLKNLDGSPKSNVLVGFRFNDETLSAKTPKVAFQGDLAELYASSYLEARSDESGTVSVNLPRSAKLEVYFAGEEDQCWPFTVPDADAVNLAELMHPIPAVLDWDDDVAPANAVTLAADGVLEVPFTVLFTDFVYRHEGLRELLTMVSADPSVVTCEFKSEADGVIVLRAVSPGTTTVTPGLNLPNLVPARFPAPTLSAPTLNVTVSP
jgi:hypothetical protein